MFSFLDPIFIIKTAGLIGIVLIVFAESGLFFGFFLPGDSLLFTAGLIASHGTINIYALLVLSFLCAVLGDSTGFWFGKKVGPALFKREKSFFFRPEHLEKTKKFYDKYGKKTIILARFLPIVRTFAPILAGVGEMKYRTFFAYNVIGGLLWTQVMILLGFALGNLVPNIEKYIIPIVGSIIVVSFLPGIRELYIARRDSHSRE